MGFHRGFIGGNSLISDTPSWVSVTSTAGSIALDWTRPYSDDYNITGYEVQQSTDQSTWSTPANIVYNVANSSAVVTGLTHLTAYYFRVRAIVGGTLSGVWSLTSEAVTYIGLPSKPAAPVAYRVVESGSVYLDVYWDAPAANGTTITGYTVTRSYNGGSFIQLSINWPYTSIRYVGVGAGVTSIVRVAAVTADGQGPFSDWSNAITI
jgi:hypothetical protein